MISMTGYGRAAANEGGYEVSVEVSSVNKRNLDIAVSLPREWKELEAVVLERTRGSARRGRVSVSVRVGPAGGDGEAFWNGPEIDKVLRRLRSLATEEAIPFEPDVALLYRIARDCAGAAEAPEPAVFRDCVERTLVEALDRWSAMRREEGGALAADLRERVRQLRSVVATIESTARKVVPAYRELLHGRLRQAGLEIDLSDERVLKEIALFADRCDISEEVTRLKSHLEQLDALIGEAGEPVGRKADFLVQEIGREFNTIGSKANDLGIARLVIDGKNELERVREQLQNVE